MEAKHAEPFSRAAGLAWLVSRIRPRTGRTMVAIDGVDGAGKTTFAADLAEELTDSGLTVIRVSFDDFLNPAEVRHAQGLQSPEGFVADTYDYERFIDDVLEPLGCEGCGRYRIKSYDYTNETPLSPPCLRGPPRSRCTGWPSGTVHPTTRPTNGSLATSTASASTSPRPTPPRGPTWW